MRILLLMCLLACCISCQQPPKEVRQDEPLKSLKLNYATGFEVDYYDGYKVVRVTKPYMGAKTGFEYILKEKDTELSVDFANKMVIEVPLTSIVCTSTTHIPLLDYLKESDKLSGFPTTDYISSATMRALIDNGSVQELGVDKEINLEQLVDIAPSMVMAYTIGGDYGQFSKMEQLGIPVVLNAEYLEEHPLGRAEWLKFMAAFFNKEQMADSVFSEIEQQYLQYKALVKEVESKPTVLSGVVYGDTWYMPGGQNYAAKMINDAGGNYLWSGDSTRGFLELSFEAVYEKAHQADYWIGVASFENLTALVEADTRYGDFEAFKNEHVYTNNWRKGAKGGSEFLELGYLRPDIILADLIKILHPQRVPDYQLYFHQQLKK